MQAGMMPVCLNIMFIPQHIYYIFWPEKVTVEPILYFLLI